MVYDVIEPPIEQCTKCENKLYGYSDGRHNIYLCWNCGAYFIYPVIRDKFTDALLYNPQLLLELIRDNKMAKI